jgi:hypothetical protein
MLAKFAAIVFLHESNARVNKITVAIEINYLKINM